MLNKINNSSYTIALDTLVNAIHGDNETQLSLFEEAKEYFIQAPQNAEKLRVLQDQIDKLNNDLVQLSGKKHSARLVEIEKLEKDLKLEQLSQQHCRTLRLRNAIKICMDILLLSEGEDYAETQQKSSKFLATLVLFSQGSGKKLAEKHQSLKPAYKAVLSLRVLDKLLSSGTVKNAYMLSNYIQDERYTIEQPDHICFTQSVILPVMLASIFQDVGLQHPDLINLLDGEEGDKDRFRLLENDERNTMLKLNYRYTIDYLKHGLGCQLANTGDKETRKAFNIAEQKRLKFQLALVEDANSTKLGSSEIIKIPQIYASVVFSTKRKFDRKSLATASILIAQLAVKKKVSSPVANAFVSIVGQFPLGYGIVYIPRDMRGSELEIYEYAIVTGLNPEKSEEPICRPVSKNLMFLEFSKKEVIEKTRNLHFHGARKKLEKVDPKRLSEIMQKLKHNFKPEQLDELLPYNWEPYTYFCIEGMQNLWNQTN